jgi:hypothetical protein
LPRILNDSVSKQAPLPGLFLAQVIEAPGADLRACEKKRRSPYTVVREPGIAATMPVAPPLQPLPSDVDHAIGGSNAADRGSNDRANQSEFDN